LEGDRSRDALPRPAHRGVPIDEETTNAVKCLVQLTGQTRPVGQKPRPGMRHDTGPSTVTVVSGRVVSGSDAQTAYTDAVERWSPTSKQWNRVKPLHETRHLHTTTLLTGGTVLVAGGEGRAVSRKDAFIYDINRDRWSEADFMTEPRQDHVAVKLKDGRVLFIGGNLTGVTELYV
jgi:Galactose oxidase, central domain